MSYVHGKEYFRATGASLASAAVIATFSPGVHPFKLRKAAIVVSTQPTVTPPVVTIRHRPTAGSTTGQTTVDTITVPTSAVAGKILYVEDLDQLVKPGEHIVFEVTTAATAGAGDVVAEFDPVWEHFANNANATVSA